MNKLNIPETPETNFPQGQERPFNNIPDIDIIPGLMLILGSMIEGACSAVQNKIYKFKEDIAHVLWQ